MRLENIFKENFFPARCHFVSFIHSKERSKIQLIFETPFIACTLFPKKEGIEMAGVNFYLSRCVLQIGKISYNSKKFTAVVLSYFDLPRFFRFRKISIKDFLQNGRTPIQFQGWGFTSRNDS